MHAGARVIATAGSAQKLAFCRDLGADVVINYREEDFVAAVLEATDGRGVDVAFDAIGGATTTETFKCMAFNGQLLTRRRVPCIRRRSDRLQGAHRVQLPRASGRCRDA